MRRLRGRGMLPVIFMLIMVSGCSDFRIQLSQPTPDIEKTVYWMIDESEMRLSTRIMGEVELKFSALQPAPTIPEKTADATNAVTRTAALIVTTIPDALKDKGSKPTAATPVICVNGLEFVEDITIKDKTVVVPGKPFTKTWKVKNTGTCEWNDTYKIVFSHGDQMDALSEISFPKSVLVEPNDTIELSVYMTAPSSPGSYAGYWLLQSGSGQKFGAGQNRDKAIWVKVEVR